MKHLSEEHKRKIGLSKLGKKRKPFSKEWREKMRINFLKRGWVGSNSPTWKGDAVGYKGVHQWVYRTLGLAKDFPCGQCGTKKAKRMEWANLNNKYRRIAEDWKPMCKSCHWKYDQENFGSYKNTAKTRKKKSLAASKRWRDRKGLFV